MPPGVSAVSNRFAFTRALTLNDSGVYRCEAANEMGVRSYDLSLWVQGNVPLGGPTGSLACCDSPAPSGQTCA